MGDGRKDAGERSDTVDPQLLMFARRLREEQSEAESLLWRLLRNRRFDNFKFRRQYPASGYVVDFYCHEARLGIELDGGQHGEPEQEARDEKRTAHLEAQGIRIRRFWNNEVFENTEGVLMSIHEALLSRARRGGGQDPCCDPDPHPGPLPGGEGN